MSKKTGILDIEYKDLELLMQSIGAPKYRVKQFVKWVYQKREDDFDKFTDMPGDLREQLKNGYILRSLNIQSKEVSKIDGTIRYNFITQNREIVPSVFLPNKDRNTVCISTQIGCSIGCNFCRSGKEGFLRNLSRGEILEQLFIIEKDTEHKIDGVLFMGMGEPLLNYENTFSAVKAITDKSMMGLGRRHVTVSTVGIVPKINQMIVDKIDIRLAVSLHAPDDETRAKLIPAKRAPYPVKEILQKAYDYAQNSNSRLTIEYILINQLNDTLQHAQKLAKIVNAVSRKSDDIQINLIPYNCDTKDIYKQPDNSVVSDFRDFLVQNNLLAMIRAAKGKDIGSACGQLGV